MKTLMIFLLTVATFTNVQNLIAQPSFAGPKGGGACCCVGTQMIEILRQDTAAAFEIQTITGVLGFPLEIKFIARDQFNEKANSIGFGNQQDFNSCIFSEATVGFSKADLGFCVRVDNAGNGWLGASQNYTYGSFEMLWGKLGSGVDLQVRAFLLLAQ